MRTFFDLQRREIVLGRCLGRGGEGAVYAVPRRPRLVAKIYAQRPNDELVRKLGAMIAIGLSSPFETLAWPEGLLLDGRGGAVVGFLMPRVDGHRPLHVLYSPRTRSEDFPEARWDFLVRAARNLASVFESVHARGLVVGDVNEGNAVVSSRATVRLIDCDSFQVSHGGRTYPCRVGVPLFTPPELRGASLDSVLRTPDHDRFGLAVLIFQLLFMGRHPYAGRHPTREITVETAIDEGLFAFGWEAARLGWEAPPLSLRLADVPSSIGALFEKAFSREAAAGKPRPTAGEWVQALEQLEAQLVTCASDSGHRHARASGPCPWCQIEERGGPVFFAVGDCGGGAGWAAAWRAIEAVRPPGPAVPPAPRSFPGIVGRPEPPAVARERLWRYAAAAAIAAVAIASLASGMQAGALAILALARLRRFPDEQDERDLRRRALESCEEELRLLESDFRSQGSDRAFVRKLEDLTAARDGLEHAAEVEGRERRELVARLREERLQSYLQRHELTGAPILGLGASELHHLQGNGICSAADVSAAALAQRPEPYGRSPQVTPALAAALLAWRAQLEAVFTCNPEHSATRDFRDLEEQQRQRRQGHEQALRTGAAELRRLRGDILAGRRELLPAFSTLHRRLAQARADLERL